MATQPASDNTSATQQKWYAVRAISGQEKKTKQYVESELNRLNLADYVHEILIPTEKVFEMRQGKKRVREKNTMPGYMLVSAELNAEVISAIKDTPGIIGFVGEDKGKVPIPLRESEVNHILGKIEEIADRGEVMANPYMVGEAVKVMDGPFAGFDAQIEEVDEEKQRLRVTVKIFGRSTPLELKYLQVERIA